MNGAHLERVLLSSQLDDRLSSRLPGCLLLGTINHLHLQVLASSLQVDGVPLVVVQWSTTLPTTADNGLLLALAIVQLQSQVSRLQGQRQVLAGQVVRGGQQQAAGLLRAKAQVQRLGLSVVQRLRYGDGQVLVAVEAECGRV